MFDCAMVTLTLFNVESSDTIFGPMREGLDWGVRYNAELYEIFNNPFISILIKAGPWRKNQGPWKFCEKCSLRWKWPYTDLWRKLCEHLYYPSTFYSGPARKHCEISAKKLYKDSVSGLSRIYNYSRLVKSRSIVEKYFIAIFESQTENHEM